MTEKQRVYYDQASKGYTRVYHNQQAYRDWFIPTEPANSINPEDKLPTHTKAMSTVKAKTIMIAFVSKLTTDVLKNSKKSWHIGTDLPPKGSPVQPLGEKQNLAVS